RQVELNSCLAAVRQESVSSIFNFRGKNSSLKVSDLVRPRWIRQALKSRGEATTDFIWMIKETFGENTTTHTE
ncbi:hypothetical protein KUCAC02_017038, partial [Chaenocephalus aceratus]